MSLNTTYILTFERKQYNEKTNIWDLWVTEKITCLGKDIPLTLSRFFDIRNLKIEEADNDDSSSSLTSDDETDYQSNLVPDNSHYEDMDGEWQPYRSNNR